MRSPWDIPELLVRGNVFHGPQLGIVLLPVTDVLLHIVDQFIFETFEIRRTHRSRANRRRAQNTTELLLFIFFFFADYQHSPRSRNVIKLLVLQALWFFPWVSRGQSTVTAVRVYSAPCGRLYLRASSVSSRHFMTSYPGLWWRVYEGTPGLMGTDF